MNSQSVTVIDLSPVEMLPLVEGLWDDLATNPNSVPNHNWQKEELLRRKIPFESNPSLAMDWKETKLWIRAQNNP